MQEFNIDSFNNFIHDLLENRMTDDDYTLVMDELGFPRPHGTNPIMYKSGCHNVDFSHAKYNLAYYPETRSFYCFSECQKSFNILDLVKTRFELIGDGKTTYKCVQWICQICSIPFDFADTEQKVIEYDWKKDLYKYRKGKKNIDKQEIKVYDDTILNYFPKIYHTNWLSYGISEQSMDKFNLRYYPYKNSILLPCYDRLGRLRGIRTRVMDEIAIENGSPRYIPLTTIDGTTYKFSTGGMLYGEYQNENNVKESKELWLCESEKAIMKFDTWTNGKSNAMAMMGSSISDESIMYILSLGVVKVILMLDSDYKEYGDEEFQVFEKKIMKLASRLTPYVTVYCLYNNLGYDAYKFSPTDYTKEQFKELWKSKERLE